MLSGRVASRVLAPTRVVVSVQGASDRVRRSAALSGRPLVSRVAPLNPWGAEWSPGRVEASGCALQATLFPAAQAGPMKPHDGGETQGHCASAMAWDGVTAVTARASDDYGVRCACMQVYVRCGCGRSRSRCMARLALAVLARSPLPLIARSLLLFRVPSPRVLAAPLCPPSSVRCSPGTRAEPAPPRLTHVSDLHHAPLPTRTGVRLGHADIG